MQMSNPRNPKVCKEAILCVVLGVCWAQQSLYHWIVCVHRGLLLAMAETHHQTQVSYDRGHDHLKARFNFSKISALTNPYFNKRASLFFSTTRCRKVLFPPSVLVWRRGLR